MDCQSGNTGVGFQHSLKVWKDSSSCCSVGKYHDLVVDASFDWRSMGEPGKVEHQPGCSILDKLQGFDGTSGKPSQQ